MFIPVLKMCLPAKDVSRWFGMIDAKVDAKGTLGYAGVLEIFPALVRGR